MELVSLSFQHKIRCAPLYPYYIFFFVAKLKNALYGDEHTSFV